MDKKSDERILVVDDDATSRKMLVRTLSSAGYDCYESDNGAETLKLVHGEQPSLLLLDFDMPGLDGAEVLKQMRADRDLAVARLTQQSLIPQKPPALPGWEVAACYRPVIQVGGDIYGWLRMRDGRILFWIADGTGH